jgi:methylglyoxal synthase
MEIAMIAHDGKNPTWFISLLKIKPYFKMLIRICDVHNVPLATNEATAQLLLKALAVD